MKIDSSLPNAFNPQTMAAQTSKKAGLSVCQGYIRCGNDLVQKHEHKPIVDYQVRQLAGVALKAGTILMRRAAGFAFSEVMNSPYVGGVAPGLKESMLFFAALYNQQQMAQAESRSSQLHSTLSATTTPVTTAIDTELTPSTFTTPGQTKTPEAITASVQTPTCSQTTTSAQTTTPEAMTASASPPTPDPTTAPQAACADDQFTCDNGECIGKEHQCDGSKEVRYMDCEDGSDEDYCTPDVCNKLKRFICADGTKCISLRFRCSGISGADTQCGDGSHLDNCTEDVCSKLGRFICNNGECRPSYVKCDGDYDCADYSDERGCSTFTTPAQTTTPEQLTTSEQLTTPTQTILETSSPDIEFEHSTDASSELSAYALFAIPAVLAVGVGSYALCTYASYKAIKRAAPTLPTGQALSRSLWHPLSFRQSQQQLAAVAGPSIGSDKDKTAEVLEMQQKLV